MSLLSHLDFQKIDDTDDDAPFSNGIQDEEIDLKEQLDEKELENYWEEVVEDLEKDPDWFTFADE